MKKNLILLFSLILGLAILVYSWSSSYPLSIGTSLDEFAYNNISIMYWLALPLTLVSMYLINMNVKNQLIKWLITFCLVLTMYSISYFYYMLPTSDSHYFRGLTEAFINTNDSSNWAALSLYFEWPNFFILGKMATAVSGLNLVHYEFLLYTVIGFLLVTSLYCYYSKTQKKMAFMAVTAYFIVNYYYLNFQNAPFSLALSLLFILFMLEKNLTDSSEKTLIRVGLFIGITATHAFVPLFYIIFQLVSYLLDRNPTKFRLFLLTTAIFSAWQIFQAPLSFARNLQLFISANPEYSTAVEGTLETALIPLDATAQTVSRFVVITTAIVSGIGFVTLWIKKKVKLIDKALLISGALYSILGILLFLLGTRALSLVTIPISLGVTYWYKSEYRKYIKCLFFILLILFMFIPLHQSFYDRDVFFQTRESYQAENFFLDNYNGTTPHLILANYRVYTYLHQKINGSAYFTYNPLDFNKTDVLVYTVGLGRDLLKQNYTIEEILSDERMNVIYSNGISSVAIRR